MLKYLKKFNSWEFKLWDIFPKFSHMGKTSCMHMCVHMPVAEYVHLCMYMLVCACASACKCMCECMHMYLAGREQPQVLFFTHSTWFWDRAFHLPEAREPQVSPCLCLSSAGIASAPYHTWIHFWFLGLKLMSSHSYGKYFTD